MKKIYLSLALILSSSAIFAQLHIENRNVGIGTDPSEVKLEISSDTNAVNPTVLRLNKVYTYPDHNDEGDETGMVEFSLSAESDNGIHKGIFAGIHAERYRPNNTGGSLILSTKPAGKGGLGTQLEERVVINHDGNVGIGSNQPMEKLEVNGNVLIKDNNALILTSPNGTPYRITVDDQGNLVTNSVFNSTPSLLKEKSTEIYPNPATNVVNVQIKESEWNNLKLELTDISGKLVHSSNVSSSNVVVDLKDLPSGIYILNLKNAEGMIIESDQVIKQ